MKSDSVGVIGQWAKGKLVGCGSFGTVHLAMNKSTGGLFVVKSSHSRAGREALDKEVKILKTLNASPYIVQCLGTEEEKGKLNVFMEYMAGGSLADVVHQFGGSLDEELVRVYTREILLGLNHLHKHGIVHCDVKCKNVLLGSSGNIKLADFGCATKVRKGDSTFATATIGGTPLWMAPEVLRNESLDFVADIWSLGCTVIEMATGTSPWPHHFVSNPIFALLKIAHGHALPQFPPHFSKDGLDFLTKCLDIKPNNRSSAQELLAHPFVSSHPSSSDNIFDFQNFKDTYGLEELQCSEENNFSIPNTNTFASHHHHPQGIPICKLEDSALGSSGTWITVRSS